MKKIGSASHPKESKRHIAQSERAMLQPRDSRGRFTGYDTVMVIDEFGNPGLIPRKSETKFGYAISVMDDPDAFGRITDYSRRNNEPERKARDDHINQYRVAEEIHRMGVRTSAFYVDKANPPNYWKDKNRGRAMRRTLDISMSRAISKTNGNVFVVVDNHSASKGQVGQMISSKSGGGRLVGGGVYDSHAGLMADVLQTHDHVANSARASIETGDSRRAKMLKMKIEKIGEDDADAKV